LALFVKRDGKMPIKVNVDASKLLNRLNQFETNLNTLPWMQAGGIVRNSILENFVAQGRPKKWAPRKDKLSHPILDKSGKLKGSIDIAPIKDGVSVGTRGISYAKFPQLGTKKMVARPYVMVQGEDIKDIQALFRKHLLSGSV